MAKQNTKITVQKPTTSKPGNFGMEIPKKPISPQPKSNK